MVPVDVILADRRVHLFEHRVVGGGAEESVGTQQCSGAHTADLIEQGPPAGLSPTDEEAGTEGTVLASTREGELIEGTAVNAFEVARETLLESRLRVGAVVYGRKPVRVYRIVPVGQPGVGR